MHKHPSDVPFPANPAPSRVARGPVLQFAMFSGVGAFGVVGISLVLSGLSVPPVALAFVGYGIGIALAFGLLLRGFDHKTLGACNIVTLARFGLAASLLAPLIHLAVSPWVVFGLAALALGLDGVDGWLARRHAHSSAFGARFDMEVDAALGLILALNAWVAGAAGPLVLLLGIPRYVFAAAGLWLPWLNRALPDSFARKAVCVLQIAALILLQLPVVPSNLGNMLVTVVAAALLWSFGRDVFWLWGRRA